MVVAFLLVSGNETLRLEGEIVRLAHFETHSSPRPFAPFAVPAYGCCFGFAATRVLSNYSFSIHLPKELGACRGGTTGGKEGKRRAKVARNIGRLTKEQDVRANAVHADRFSDYRCFISFLSFFFLLSL